MKKMPQLNGVVPSTLGHLQEHLELRLVCSKCSLQENESTYRLNEIEHCCMMEILLVKRKGKAGRLWRKVGRRPGFPKHATYEVCKYYVPGSGCKRYRNHCSFAWCQEEVMVWTFERLNQMERHTLKMLVWQAQTGGLPNGPSVLPEPSIAEEIRSEFGGHFQEICRPCFYQSPSRISFKGSRNCVTHWEALLVHVVVNGKMKEQYTEIRPCLGSGAELKYCLYVSAGKQCIHGARKCCFAHSDVEMAVWEAEKSRGLARTDLLPPVAECSHKEQPSVPKLQFYCRVCLVTCDSQESFENHCSSMEHAQMITTDTMIQWTHRTPPYGLRTFALCGRVDVCEYGQDCTMAHSTEELEEWIQRAKVAKDNKKFAKQDGLLAYQDRLIAEYQESYNEVLIISEQVEGVTVTCQQPLRLQSEDKKMQYKWAFTVHSKMPLMHVALLKRVPGATFSLGGNGLPRGLTYAMGERFKTLQASSPGYVVEVSMESFTFGIYEQWLALDFGSRPVLVRKLQAKIGRKETPWHVDPTGEHGSHFVEFERWHRGNRVVVPCVPRSSNDMELLAKYKTPSLSLDFWRGTEGKPIDRSNYRQQIHNFLFREEEAEQAVIARLNLQVTVSLQQMLETSFMGMQFAPPGELYAKVPIPYSLTVDSSQGYLLLRSVKTAFLAPDQPCNNCVYEVSVESKAITEKTLWLLLPKRCCFELGLKAGTSLRAEIQFQIDQLEFRRWHQAVDKLVDERLVLPEVIACCVPQPLGQGLLPGGNKKQNQAISFITGQADGVRQVPPLLIYGPFGTGKTFTLAKAALEIIKQAKTRVLICTHNNSAADSYIREYFHDYVTSGHPEAVPLRVTFVHRSIKTTDDITRLYCCLSANKDSFRLPTQEELDRHCIIITTSTFSQALGVPPGYFSHILIDEAAQMLECEALVPLSLATLETRVVLAGDHMQMTPKLFCLRGDEQSANHTLLFRLFQYYQKETHEVAVKSRIIFSENYRCTSGIIEFISKHFYVGKGDAICASGNVPPHPNFHPLMFCHVSGSAERDISMTSWYNTSEIMQVIEKVQEMSQKWPEDWGELDLRRICVVSYGMQVTAIRQLLRKKSLGEVVVESYDNLPGRQFRVVILSTVCTMDSFNHSISPNLDFFNDSRVLNTIMTRAQSQVIAVGDAVALCSFGQCSKVWKGFLKECIEKRTVFPESLTLEEIRQAVCDCTGWIRGSREEEEEEEEEEASDTDSWLSNAESLNLEDPVLQELLDESKDAMVTVSDEGILNVTPAASVPQSSRQLYVNYSSQIMEQYLRMKPDVYKRCELTKEQFDQASAFTLDDNPPSSIKIYGRIHCGMAFTGDQVLVEILHPPNSATAAAEGARHGKVVGVIKKVERRTFICRMDEFDRCLMTPIDKTVTKIFVPGLKDQPDLIPIRRVEHEGKFRLVKRKKMTQEEKRTSLFAVQVINWREMYYFPLGIITRILPLASTLEKGLNILDVEYSLTSQYPASVTNEVAILASGKMTHMKFNRLDCRAYPTFTVDPPGAKDLDDAISVRDLGDKYEIGIHIAEVASMIAKDCSVDTEAKSRGATYYAPGKDPVQMLPPQLGEHFSLLPQKDRHVISLFVSVEKGTDRVVKALFTVSTICSDRQMTYVEAEGIIKNYYREDLQSLHFDTLEDCVAVAYHFSCVHRMYRLHEDYYYDQLHEDSPLGQRCSHQMIEEFMIMFNNSVAEFLINKVSTRNRTPLRCQREPIPEKVIEMRDKFRELIPLSLHLSHHLGAETSDAPITTAHDFVVLKPLWDHLQLAAKNSDFPKMLDLIATDDVHPKLAPVNFQFRKLLSRSYFICSNSSQSNVGHYSLHVDSYTWASSPIRRYVDIVVQRHLLSVLLKKPVLYTPEDIEFLCRDFSQKNSQANSYEKKAHSLVMAARLKCQVQQKVAFVMNVDEKVKNFKILFPLNKETVPDPLLVNYRALQLVTQPSLIPDTNSMSLTWKRRIYSVNTSKDWDPKSAVLKDKGVTLLNVEVWCDILAAIRKKDYTTLISLLQKEQSKPPRAVGRMKRSKCLHYFELSLELSVGDVLNVQLSTDVQRGFLVPFVQLWTVAPGFDVCLEHTEKPIDCFCEYATQKSKDKYKNTLDYRKVWLPLSDMEATSCAVSENDSIILYDVQIVWERQRTKKHQLQGAFCLTQAFLKECSIKINFNHCYLCIRLSGLKLDRAQSNEETLSHSLQDLSLTKENADSGMFAVDSATYTWVSHGRTEEFDAKNSDCLDLTTVRFYIHYMSMENVPVEISQDSSRFTVELIPVLLPDIRKKEAVCRLQHATELAKCIALGKDVPEPARSISSLLRQKTFATPGSRTALNPSQNRAILEALRRSYTLIQGPPGTGKTVVGTHIVYWFHQLNKEAEGKAPTQEGKKQILYCGPSNKSVDVVAEMLMRYRSHLSPLRVYGNAIESMDFPYPGSSLHISQKALRDSKPKQEIRDITLHYRIRKEPNPWAREICAFDARVRSGKEISEEEVTMYERLLLRARKYELQRHDIILCTCSAACSKTMTKTLNVKQVLIDECAMCTEPETLIPLVSHDKIEKVVLLGDHKQLRPVVHNDLCKMMGMEISLFERYHEQALMLNIQYRMHQGICQFPSEAFYENKLKTWSELRRRPSKFCHHHRDCCPIIFGHIKGTEKSLIVSTEEGNESSMANPEEAEQAVRIAKQLTLDRTVKPQDIAILTPYNAQVFEIKNRLSQIGLRDLTVCTIMKSQGSEWKYVIVSTVRSCCRSMIDERPTKGWQKKHLGFVTDENQVNVAITRAQEGLCIIGNGYLLETHALWRKLVGHYRKYGCYTTANAIGIKQEQPSLMARNACGVNWETTPMC